MRIQTTGAHPFVWVALPLGLALTLGGIMGLVTAHDAGMVIGGIAALLLGGAWLASCAYSAWGSLELELTAIGIRITTRLASWSRTTEIVRGRIRSVELYSPPPYVVVWPGSAGRQLRVQLDGRDRPIHVAAGLSLAPDVLEAIRGLLSSP